MPTGREVEIIAATLNRILNQDGYAYDNIFGRIPTVQYLLIKDAKDKAMKKLSINTRVRELDGGYEIEIPVEYAQGKSLQSYDGLDEIDFVAQEILANVKYAWKNLVDTLLIDKKDILRCSGDNRKIASLTETKLSNMMKTFATGLNTMLLATSPGADDFHSIPKLVQDDPTATDTVGGIAQATASNSWWRNRYKDSAATTYQLLVNEITHEKNVIKGNIAGDGPDLMLTDQIVYEYLIAYQTSKGVHTFQDNEMSNLLNTDEVGRFRGMTVLWDAVPESTSGSKSRIYLLNTDYIQLVVHKDRKFDVTEKMDMLAAQKQDAVAWAIFLMGNLTTSNRNKQGVIFDIAQNFTA